MLNNRGQSLILFVIALPIILLIAILVIDVGRVIVRKQELSNISNIVLDYGLDNLEQDDIYNELLELVKLNDSEIDEINIFIEDNKIKLELKDSVNGVFSYIENTSIFNVKSSYVGYLENGNKRIEKVSGWLMCIIQVEK